MQDSRDARPQFVGRADELATLRASAAEAQAGRGSVVLVGGEAGLGKTHLVDEALRHVSATTPVLDGSCQEASSGAPPYWPWTQVLRGIAGFDAAVLRPLLSQYASPVLEIAPELGSSLPETSLPPPLDDPKASRFRLLDALSRFITDIAQDHTIIIRIEDLHWADTGTLDALVQVARLVARSHLLVLGTYRELEARESEAMARALATLRRSSGVIRVELKHWSEETTREYLTARITGDAAREIGHRVHRLTGGLPLFVKELVEHLAANDGPAANALAGMRRPPASVREMVAERTRPLQAATLDVLRAAAVVGPQFSVDDLDGLADLDRGDRLWEHVDLAVRLQLIEERRLAPGVYQFRHVLIQHAFLDQLAPSVLARRHAEVGAVLEQRGAGAQVSSIAAHYERAGSFVAREIVAGWALRAGDQAMAAYATDNAEEHYQRGLAAVDEDPTLMVTGKLLFGLSWAVRQSDWRSSRPLRFRAFDVFERIGATADAIQVALADRGLPARFGGDPVPMLRRALALADRGSIEAAQLQVRLARFAPGPDEAAKLVANAVTSAERRGDRSALADVLLYAAGATQDPEQRWRDLRRAVEASQGIADIRTRVEVLGQAADAALSCGRLDEAEPLARLAVEEAPPSKAGVSLNTLSKVLLNRAELGAFFTVSDQAIAAAPSWFYPFGLRAHAEYAAARNETADEWAARFVDLYQSEREMSHATVERFLTFHELSGDARWLTRARALVEVLLARDGAMPRLWLWAAWISLADGDVLGAADWYERIGQQERNLFTWHRLGQLAHAVGDRSAARSTLAHAWDQHRVSGYGLLAVATGHAYGQALLDSNVPEDRKLAGGIIDETLARAERHGLHAWVGKLRSLETKEPVPADRLPDGLTEREAEVLRLVARGKSNKVIAADLHLTTSTIATHLRSAYGKIGAGNRADATAYAIRAGLVDPS